MNVDSDINDCLLPIPTLENDENMNNWLKNDLIDKQTLNKSYKKMAVRNRLLFYMYFTHFIFSEFFA